MSNSELFKTSAPTSNFSLKHLNWGIKFSNFFGQFKLQKYSPIDSTKSYYLISDQCLPDYDIDDNHLEDFLHDFEHCDWDSNLFEQYKAIFREINPELFPKYYCVKHSANVQDEMKKAFNEGLKYINDNGYLEDYIGIMSTWLYEVKIQEEMHDDLSLKNSINSINNSKSKLGL
ncbi:hypothetical protein LB465_17300 [Salegentibacter sp. LM13S]|uniref:hypothetical protein n=1 Tax=Salegentibacter lacus TaxID=2873599 RepID=UPI001CD00063|nr:hypothetical protein [Salegentibacter lacus]MBZ9632539.1 hypothetical protein [Salegentibacter lacus]